MPKEKLKELKRQTEQYVLQKYPELEQKITIQNKKQKQKEKISQKGVERKRRTGKLPERERVVNDLRGVFKRSKTKQEFFEALRKAKLGLNEPGKRKYISIKDLPTGRNHRVTTLGLSDEFREMSARIDLEVKREESSSRKKPKQEHDEQDQYKQAQGTKEDLRSPQQKAKPKQERKGGEKVPIDGEEFKRREQAEQKKSKIHDNGEFEKSEEERRTKWQEDQADSQEDLKEEIKEKIRSKEEYTKEAKERTKTLREGQRENSRERNNDRER